MIRLAFGLLVSFNSASFQPTIMKLFRLALFVAPLLLASCGSVKIPSVDAPGIVVAQEEIREVGQGKMIFPAGVYKAEVTSDKGTYYKAPRRIKTLGVLIGRSQEGGLYVSKYPGTPQSAWFGDPRDEVDASPGTLFGAMGVSAPKLRKLTPPVPYTLEGASAMKR